METPVNFSIVKVESKEDERIVIDGNNFTVYTTDFPEEDFQVLQEEFGTVDP